MSIPALRMYKPYYLGYILNIEDTFNIQVHRHTLRIVLLFIHTTLEQIGYFYFIIVFNMFKFSKIPTLSYFKFSYFRTESKKPSKSNY